ncbi:hypothetical protein V7S43_011450 [Phytophthora oleae]|uniref:non-specific serine/threonine protein kinase n=1 Tax=Phytophthora oleae TaxID=2107226 RepID=A0ABD3FCA8_9STRA
MATGSKWQVQSDDDGNLYFYNSQTEESVWELPEEEDEDEIPDENEKQIHSVAIEKPKEQHSVYAVALGVADAMVNLVESIEINVESEKKSNVKRKFMSPAAEKRFLKNAVNDEKKKKHLHDRSISAYVDVLILRIEAGGSVVQEESTKLRDVGSLFTAEESRTWQQERENEREAKRRAVRRARKQHQVKVETLQKHQQMLILFRSDLMKYLLGKISCSTELQRQRILLLTTPQMLAEMKEKKKELRMTVEPEIAEKMEAEERSAQQEYEKNVRKVFTTIDEARVGKLHLLQILFGLFSQEQPQKYAAKVRGLAELLGSADLQRFLINFVSQSSKKDAKGPHLITVREFKEFVTIIEEVLDHSAGVKAAVEDAENDIEEALASSVAGGVSLARARMGAMSAKKIRHELTVLKEQETELQAVRHREKRRGFNSERESLVAPVEEWKKKHHHRLIRLEETLPVYCCLCRRRKWELWRREQEEIESEYRSHWPTMRAVRVKDEELRFVQERDHQNGIFAEKNEETQPTEEVTDVQPTKYELREYQGQDEVLSAVQLTLVSLVLLVESTAKEESLLPRQPQRKNHKNPVKSPKKSPKKRIKEPPTTEVQDRMEIFESEENERKTMYTEELHMVIMLERNRRLVERNLLRAQDAGHDALVRLLEHCVNLSGFLTRLEFECCLSFSPPQKMVLSVTDQGVKSEKRPSHLVLQTIPCRTEEVGDFIFDQGTVMKKSLHSPFVAEVVAVDKHMFQSFSELGLLTECWPVVFVVIEYFKRGSWLVHYRKHFLSEGNGNVKYAVVEQHLRNVFREVASGLAAMHSIGLVHLNINLGNIYVADDQDDNIHVKIGSLLSWKHDFDASNLKNSVMHEIFNCHYSPPEVAKELPITAKSDVWMLGCTLCEALFMYQQHQLMLSTPNQPQQCTQPLIFHTKAVGELLQKVPIATSSSMRSLIRMLLQSNPAQRPQMSQVVDLLRY